MGVIDISLYDDILTPLDIEDLWIDGLSGDIFKEQLNDMLRKAIYTCT